MFCRQEAIAAFREEELFIPASTWKIASALSALNELGADFRFETLFYLDNNRLLIKGSGDPMLVSEEARLISEALARLGLREIEGITIDDSFFRLTRPAPDGSAASLRAYDAANSATLVNFNTVYVEVKADAKAISAEAQTPTLPIMQEAAAGLAPGRHRVNLSANPENIPRYTGELFKHMLEEQGIRVKGGVRVGEKSAAASLLYRHYSSVSLDEVVAAMLLYSNNLVANQVLLRAAASHYGPPASWEKARDFLALFLKNLGLSEESYQVEEGSGLSRRNRVSPAALLQITESFKPYAHLLPLDAGRRIKSGTLNGVYAYSGFFLNRERLDPFVIILNQPANTRDRAVAQLERYYRRHCPE